MFLTTDINLEMAHFKFEELKKTADHIRQLKKAKKGSFEELPQTIKFTGIEAVDRITRETNKAGYTVSK
jgi:hypothetical protein